MATAKVCSFYNAQISAVAEAAIENAAGLVRARPDHPLTEALPGQRNKRPAATSLWSRARIDIDWPYQIALPIEAAGGRNTIIIQRFCRDLSICPRHKRYLIDGHEFIVHCFATRSDAEFFQTYFGGEFIETGQPRQVYPRIAAEVLALLNQETFWRALIRPLAPAAGVRPEQTIVRLPRGAYIAFGLDPQWTGRIATMNALLNLAADPTTWIALVTLIGMELVLGIDNLVFIAILTNKLPENQRNLARRIGIGLAVILRLMLLGAIAFIVSLTTPLFTLLGQGFSWRDLILIAGGLFLVWKATKEIHHRVDPDPGPDLFDGRQATLGFGVAMGQIVILDLVFSIDSIITAVGMTPHVPIMVIAIVVAVFVMLIAATPLANFIAANPTIVMLALGFLLMIGMVLIAEGFGAHVSKGYIYAAMAFSVAVEGLNMLARQKRLAATKSQAVS